MDILDQLEGKAEDLGEVKQDVVMLRDEAKGASGRLKDFVGLD
jgi:hypothetical protein